MSTVPVLSITQRLGQHHQQWAQAITAFGRNLRCAIPGTIVAVDLAGTQTVTVQPALNEEIILNGQVQKIALPQLVKVPLVMYRGGGFSITLPIQINDECLVIFGDMCIDNWWQNGAEKAPQDQVEIRRHDLSDGFAILGPWSQPRRLSNYSTSSMQIRSDDGQTIIDIANGVVTITAATVQVNATNATVAAQQVAQVTGQTVKITGSTSVAINGTDWQTHTHSGVTAGGAITGPVAT